MKQNVRKVLAVSGMAIVIGASSFGYEASANFSNNSSTKVKNETRIRKQEHRISGKKRTIPGRIASINGAVITLTKGNKTYTVNTNTETKFLNRKWATIAIGNLKVGDKLRIRGTVLEKTITAETVRDISIL